MVRLGEGGFALKTPDEIKMNEENAFLLREAAKSACAGYYDHLSAGGKGDPAEERWIEALTAGADALSYIQQLERERDAAVADLRVDRHCRTCKNSGCYPSDQPCRSCGIAGKNYEWRGVKEVTP